MKSESRIDFKLITEITDDVISQTDEKGYFQYISPSCSKLLGYCQDSLIGKNAFDYIHEDEQKEVLRLFQKGIETKRDDRIEYRIKHAQGHYVWLETTGKALLDQEEKVIGAVFNSRDVTERKILDERQNSFFSLSIDMLGIANTEGYLVEINNAWEKSLGWSIEELLSKPYLSLVHPDDRELTIKMADELMKGEQVYSFINRYLCKDGSYMWISWNFSPNDERTLIYFVARDVTEQIIKENALKQNLNEIEKEVQSRTSDLMKVNTELKNEITSRKMREKELREMKERLQLVTDNISEVIWLRSADNSRMMFVNPAFEEVWGFSCDELYKNPMAFMEAIHADDQEVVSDAYNKYLEGGKFDMSYRIVRPDGRIRRVDVKSNEARNSKGEIIGHVGSARDITDLKQYEIAIAESEKFLRESQKVGGVGSYVVDLIGDTCQSSAVLNEILGLDENELHPLEVWPTLIHPDDREAALSAHQKSIEEITDYKQEYRIIRPNDGALRWVNDTGELELDKTGSPSRLVGTIIDITERKQLEEKLTESNKMYQSLVDTQQEMICRYLPDTTITFVNDAYCRAFGKKASELVGKKNLMFIPHESHEEELTSLKRLSIAHPSDIREFEVTLPDDSTGWQHWTDVGIFDESGELIEIQGTGYDITERKQAEDEAHSQAQRAEAMLRISSHLNTELELDKVKSIICEEACSALHMQMSAYLRHDSNTRLFHLAAYSGIPEEVAQSLETLSQDDIDISLNKKGKLGVITDLSTVSELPLNQTLLNHGIRICAYTLVERDGLPLGVLIIGDENKVDLSENSLALLSGLADQAASAITNARLFSKAKNRLNQVQALRNIDLAITGSLDLRVTFQVVLDEVTKILRTDAAAILRLDPHSGTLKYEYWRGFRSSGIDRINISLGEGYAGRMALNRKSVHIYDLHESEQDLSHIPLLTEEGFVAYYAVPLIAKGTVLGVLEVFHRERIASNGEWLAFLETLAGQAAIAIDNAELFSKLERSNVDLLQAYDATIEGWAHALDLKDEETEDHSQRVTKLTLRIAGKMGTKEEDLAHVRRGALLHDIGKMGIPDSILLKPGKLTDEEWEIMRKHPVYAFEMLSSIDYLRPALDIPYCHHEKWDGSGYPRGLRGKQIPLSARIFAVVDVHDALTSDRPYRKAWTKEKTLEHIEEQSGKHFDPQVVDVFIECSQSL